MAASFACPECGRGIGLTGLAPGREVTCPGCSTRVEVPYFPRAKPRRPAPVEVRRVHRGSRRRARSASDRRRLRRGLALGAVVLVALGTWWAVGRIESGARQGQERILAGLLAASDRAAAARDPGAAFREVEAALILARRIEPPGSSRLAALSERRDRAARAEVAARLAALPNLAPDRAVGEALILVERGRTDPALASLAESIAEGTEVAILRQARSDRELARADLDAGRGVAAFERATRAFRRADRLVDRAEARRLRDGFRDLVTEAVDRFGLVLAAAPDPARRLDPADDFVGPLWAEALAKKGYLLEPAQSGWGELWATRAPFRAGLEVAETADELYQQSQNRATRIDARFRLARRGQPCWDNRIVAQTRSPILDLPAFLAGRLATATRRDPEVERRLRDDARAAFRAQALRVLRNVPAPEVAPPTPAAGSAPLPGSARHAGRAAPRPVGLRPLSTGRRSR